MELLLLECWHKIFTEKVKFTNNEMKESKKSYLDVYNKHNATIHFFANPEWLNLVAENWDVLLYQKDDKTIALLPFCTKGNFVTNRIYLPYINFYQSIIFLDKDINQSDRNRICIELFKQNSNYIKSYFKFLPEYSDIDLSNLKYKKETYTTYIIEQSYSINQLSKNHLRNINKAIQNKYTIEKSTQLEDAYKIIQSTFTKQNIKSKIDYNIFEKINKFCSDKNCGNTLVCKNTEGKLLATLFYVEDNHTVYYLLSGFNVSYKNSGAMHYMLHQLINQTIQGGKTFNFCGSSKKTIANFFKGFGAKNENLNIWTKSIFKI